MLLKILQCILVFAVVLIAGLLVFCWYLGGRITREQGEAYMASMEEMRTERESTIQEEI